MEIPKDFPTLHLHNPADMRHEQGKRVKAAVAYSGKTATQVAHEIGKPGPDGLNYWKTHGFPEAEPNRTAIMEKLGEATGVPAEFFTADWRYLHLLPSLHDTALAELRHLAEEEIRRRAGEPELRDGTDRREGDRRSRP